MDLWIVVLIGVVVAVGLGGGLVVFLRRRRRLREEFGPEYERMAAEEGKKRKADTELRDREKRREELDIRPLPPGARERYLDEWHDAQARFVDSPSLALQEADELVIRVMRERGYPMEDFEQRAADVSVDHPEVVQNYRSAHEIQVADQRGETSTEDRRQAMVQYRALFEDLLETQDA